MLDYVKNNKLGTLAMLLSLTFIFLGTPDQILKIWRTRNVESISISMFALFGIQAVCWMFYGIQKKDWAIGVVNVFASISAIVIVFEWFLFR